MGDKYVRWILFNISQMVVKLGHQCPNHPVYNYYLKKKAEGKHYYESLTACSTKILRMLYSMCKNNTTFLNVFKKLYHFRLFAVHKNIIIIL